MYYQDGLYQRDLATLKSYGGKKFKLTLHKCLRQAGFENEKEYVEKGSVNEEKLDCNISRARSKIFAYAFCNKFDHFVNLTLDKEKYDRNNLQVYISDLTLWLRNYSRGLEKSIKYLLIPEQHKDGAWHVHGLLMGVPEDHLTNFIPGIHPQKLIDLGYKNWQAYQKKFGYCSLGSIINDEAVSKYITKYVTKDMATNNHELGSRLYYCSKGLEIDQLIKKGPMSANIKPDYENDYVKVQWFTDRQAALSMITD